MKIIIVGCGGRENILSEKLKPGNEIYCIGSWINPDIYSISNDYRVVIDMSEDNVFQYCQNIKPDMVVIGSETLLNTNLVLKCNLNNFKCIGPVKLLAQLETSKIFARTFLMNNNFNNFNPKHLLINTHFLLAYPKDLLKILI